MSFRPLVETFHSNPRTVAGAAEREARLGKDGSLIGHAHCRDRRVRSIVSMSLFVRVREAFVVERDAAGLERSGHHDCGKIAPQIVALDATVAASRPSQRRPWRRPDFLLWWWSKSGARFDPSPGRSDSRAAKTDPIDAAVIARFAEANATRDPARCPTRRPGCLPHLVARRRQIIEMIGAERQREKRMAVPHLRKSIARLLKRWRRSWPASMRISTMPCAARQLGEQGGFARFRAWRWADHCPHADR